ncbi:hypothetical protein JCM10369A_42450 [Nocardioides pyridinolyticus]
MGSGVHSRVLIGFSLVGLQPDDADNFWSRLGPVIVLATGIGGACYGMVVGSKLDWSGSRPPVHAAGAVPHVDLNEGAIAGVLAARRR